MVDHPVKGIFYLVVESLVGRGHHPGEDLYRFRSGCGKISHRFGKVFGSPGRKQGKRILHNGGHSPLTGILCLCRHEEYQGKAGQYY